MTDEQAAEEARRRWGEGGHVQVVSAKQPSDLTHHVCREVRGVFYHGWGHTWEEAFASWDRYHDHWG